MDIEGGFPSISKSIRAAGGEVPKISKPIEPIRDIDVTPTRRRGRITRAPIRKETSEAIQIKEPKDGRRLKLKPSKITPSRIRPSRFGPSTLPSIFGPSTIPSIIFSRIRSSVFPSRVKPSRVKPSRITPSIVPSIISRSRLGPSRLGPSVLGPSIIRRTPFRSITIGTTKLPSKLKFEETKRKRERLLVPTGPPRVSASLIGVEFQRRFKPITKKEAERRLVTGVGVRPLIREDKPPRQIITPGSIREIIKPKKPPKAIQRFKELTKLGGVKI